MQIGNADYKNSGHGKPDWEVALEDRLNRGKKLIHAHIWGTWSYKTWR